MTGRRRIISALGLVVGALVALLVLAGAPPSAAALRAESADEAAAELAARHPSCVFSSNRRPVDRASRTV